MAKKKLSPWAWFPIASAIIFAGVIALFNVNSAFSDKYHLWAVFRYGGIVITGIGVLLFYLKVIKRSDTTPQEK